MIGQKQLASFFLRVMSDWWVSMLAYVVGGVDDYVS